MFVALGGLRSGSSADWFSNSGGPIGRRAPEVDNPSGEETRRDLAVSAAIVVACVAGTAAVAAVVVVLMR